MTSRSKGARIVSWDYTETNYKRTCGICDETIPADTRAWRYGTDRLLHCEKCKQKAEKQQEQAR